MIVLLLFSTTKIVVVEIELVVLVVVIVEVLRSIMRKYILLATLPNIATTSY